MLVAVVAAGHLVHLGAGGLILVLVEQVAAGLETVHQGLPT
jgi:hypothetical protein